jgi:hypothetical protein
MSDMTLFKNNPLVNSDLFKSLQEMNKNLAGGSTGSGVRRISIKGGRFRLIVGGEQVSVSKNSEMNIIVVNAAPISRTYYEGAYDPEKTAAPSCWSTDSTVPSKDVPADQRQAPRCADCKMNIKGSGQGESRACRFSQRLAITLEGKPDEIYQMQLPATSIFGEAKGNNMGMQAYAKFLNAHNTPAIAVLTEMRFDENNETPKLFFKPLRSLDEDELDAAVKAKESEAAIKAITMTVSQADAKPSEGYLTKTTSNDIEIEDDEVEVEAPKKAAKKETAVVEVKDTNLKSIVSAWDDE